MGNSRYNQFLYSKNPMLTYIQGSIVVGATGAVSSSTGNGIYAITRLTTGIYKVQMVDNYNAFLDGNAIMESGVMGSAVTGGSFVTGTCYQITSLGTTTTAQWVTAGLASGLTPAVGQAFVAAGAGAGTGTATAIGFAGPSRIEVVRSPNASLASSLPGQGAVILLQTLNSQGITFTGISANGSTTIGSVTSLVGLMAGQAIVGPGIVLGTTITNAALSSNSITISPAATSAGGSTGVAAGAGLMTASPGLADPISGSVIRFSFMFRNSSATY